MTVAVPIPGSGIVPLDAPRVIEHFDEIAGVLAVCHGDACAADRDVQDDRVRTFFHDVAPARFGGIADVRGDNPSSRRALRGLENQRVARPRFPTPGPVSPHSPLAPRACPSFARRRSQPATGRWRLGLPSDRGRSTDRRPTASRMAPSCRASRIQAPAPLLRKRADRHWADCRADETVRGDRAGLRSDRRSPSRREPTGPLQARSGSRSAAPLPCRRPSGAGLAANRRSETSRTRSISRRPKARTTQAPWVVHDRELLDRGASCLRRRGLRASRRSAGSALRWPVNRNTGVRASSGAVTDPTFINTLSRSLSTWRPGRRSSTLRV